jgi:hypothetical protein
MAVRPTLPYYAPAQLLPAPLPTVAQILDSTNFMVRYGEAPIVRVGEHYVVKYGKRVSLQEGENMLFVRESSNVPVPTVYALFHDEKTNRNFIIQEYIPGKILDGVWAILSDDQKTNITLQLRQHMHELRRIPSPGYYGGIWEQPLRDYYFRGVESELSAAQTTEEFWAFALWRCLGLKLKNRSEFKLILDTLWGCYQTIFRGHDPVFTHGNLSPGNIMLKEETGTVVIMNWEFSGWYPSFWEYCSAMLLPQYHHDWPGRVPIILNEHPEEYQEEYRWMWYHRQLMLHPEQVCLVPLRGKNHAQLFDPFFPILVFLFRGSILPLTPGTSHLVHA